MTGASGESIRVLHVDDDRDFLDVATTFLERQDERFVVEPVASAEAGRAQLAESDVDCVVSDYQMPGTDGLEFLADVRAEHPDLPFILFTGKGSETIASEAISAGVTDYLQKGPGEDRYVILANRIANAVETTNARRQRHRHLQAIETAREGISLLDADGHFTYVNRAYADLYGYEPGELVGEHWELLYPPDEAERVHDEILPELEAAGRWRGETIGKRADGEVIVEDHSLALTGDDVMVCIVRDVTDQHDRAEEGRRYRSELYELLSDPDLDFEATRRALLELGCEYLGVADGLLARVDVAAGRHEALAVANARDHEGTVMDLADTYCRHVVDAGDRLAVPDVGSSELAGDPAVEATGLQCYIGAPVTVNGDLYGTVCFVDPEPREPFTQAEESFVELLAHGLGSALERRRYAAELHQYRTMVNTAGDMVYVLDEEGRFELVNDAVERFTGYDREALVGADVGLLMDEADAEAERALVAGLRSDDGAGHRSDSFEWQLHTADGDVVPCESHVALLGEDGTWSGTVGVVRDMTDRKERERELEMYEAAVEAARDGITVLDADGTYQMVNGVFAEVVGLPREEILGKDPSYLIERGVIDRSAVETGIEKILECLEADAEQITFETRVSSPTFGEEVVEHNLALLAADEAEGGPEPEVADAVAPVPIDVDVSAIDGAVMTHRKISERKRREQALRERERELQRQNDRLEEFASVVSHDLRNPLSVAMGRLEMLDEDCDPDTVERIDHAHDRMARIIDDLLTLARQGEAVRDIGPVDGARVVAEAWESVDTVGGELHLDWDGRVLADGSRLQQLFENMFRNAVEHAGEDVTVRVGPLDDGSGFYVEDDGPGIPEDQRDRVLEPGYSTGEDGTGVGLNIVSDIAEAHEWEFLVTESAAGGARFEVANVAPAGDEADGQVDDAGA